MSDLLIIDDDVASCRTLQLHFGRHGHSVRLAHSFEEGLAEAERHTPELIVLDIRMPGASGLDGLPRLKQRFPQVPVIMVTAFHDMESTIEAMKRGADDYIAKPIDLAELDAAVAKGLERASLLAEAPVSATPDEAPAGAQVMVGRSRQMQEVFKTIGLAAASPITVLITGESGTGKELVARALHMAGPHPDAPFVAVNCAALVETLLESELFGHEKGAFTGAVARQPGKFAQAGEGTIFLDEIGELSPAIQAKLLRVLQEREFVPLGGASPVRSQARVVAATNLDLARRVEDGRFREDLYYRLRVVTIHVPPLRERREDLDDLVPALLARAQRDIGREARRVTPAVMAALRAYQWPGNVRELENVLMKAVALSPGEVIDTDLLPAEIRMAGGAPGPVPGSERALARLSLEEIEAAHVARVLAATGWHRGRACAILGISRPRLRRLMRQHGLLAPRGADQGHDERREE